jgi:hypothetical protein
MPQRGPAGAASPPRGGRGPPRGQSPARGAGPGGGDWASKVDPNSGKTYYFNRATGATQWEPPPGFGGAPRAASPARGQVGTGYEREMGGVSQTASVGGIDLEDTSMKLAKVGGSNLKLMVIALLAVAVFAVVAFVAMSDEDDPVVTAPGLSQGAGAAGAVVGDLCADVDCGANGQCLEEDGSCECTLGYTGTVCEDCMPGYSANGALCENVDECLGDPCGTEGVESCTPVSPPDTRTTPDCSCATGYEFSATERRCTGQNCGAFSAPAHGTAAGDTYYGAPHPLVVSCDDGYRLSGSQDLRCGPSGAWPESPTCVVHHCSRAELVLTNAEITGCGGSGCNVDSPITVNCLNGTVQETATPTCVAGAGGALPSWSSVDITCGVSDPCAGVTCGTHGACVGGACECVAGYSGEACDDCAPGYTRRDSTSPCVDVDECAGTPDPCTDTLGPQPAVAHACTPVAPPSLSTDPSCQCSEGYDLVAGGCRPTIDHAVAQRVATVVAMRNAARLAYSSRCDSIATTCSDANSNDHCTDDACNPSANWNGDEQCLHSDMFGTDELCTCDGAGRKMDAKRSTVTVNKRVDRDSPTVKEAVCFSKGLDTQFQDNVQEDGGIQFQWFASEAGPLRTYPGDARQLPTYAGGTTNGRGLDPPTADSALTVNDESGAIITDTMTCADCLAQGFQCSQCSKYGFDCTSTCPSTSTNAARLVEAAGYCNWQDPREESWYVSAVSGPKDVVIVLDMSASMSQCAAAGGSLVNCETRIEVAKVAARKVLETLSDRDYAQVVPFGSFASCYTGEDDVSYNVNDKCTSDDNKLLRMTSANRILLEQYLTELTVADAAGTGFRAGFEKAFDVLDRSVTDATSSCTKAVLFFTDGAGTREGTASTNSQTFVVNQYDALVSTINTRNNVDTPSGAAGAHAAHIFWYSVTRPDIEFTDDDAENTYCRPGDLTGEPGAADGCTPWHDLMANTFLASLNSARFNPPYAKKITCDNDGVFSHIRDPSMVEDALASYYEFLSRAAPSDTVRWSQIYTDASTGKEVIAGTLAVYTEDADPVLIGVVGMTVLVSAFDYGDTVRREELLARLADASHSSQCIARSRDINTLERLRYTFGTRIDTDRNNAIDAAYLAEKTTIADDRANNPTGYFSTCCMPDDRANFPPFNPDGTCGTPATCTVEARGTSGPINDWYDHAKCNGADIPTVETAAIATER